MADRQSSRVNCQDSPPAIISVAFVGTQIVCTIYLAESRTLALYGVELERCPLGELFVVAIQKCRGCEGLVLSSLSGIGEDGLNLDQSDRIDIDRGVAEVIDVKAGEAKSTHRSRQIRKGPYRPELDPIPCGYAISVANRIGVNEFNVPFRI